jgi:uroporphyrinogen-III decarboxylase
MEMWEFVISECANILTAKMLSGEIDPCLLNETRNVLAEMIDSYFSPFYEEEQLELGRKKIEQITTAEPVTIAEPDSN